MSTPSSETRPNQVLAIVCAGIVLANLDLFIVNVALPDIAYSFGGASLGRLSWILNGYAIVYAALLVFCGRLAERHRRDRSFLLGVAVFTAASAACAAAWSVESLVAFRLVQAAGAALLTPTSLGLILATYQPERRGNAVRIWAAVGGFAAAVGPLAGGVLVTASWRWIFLVNVPIGLLALWVGWLKLPAVPGHDVKAPRVSAAILVTVGIAALTFGIVKINEWGWRDPGVGVSFAVSAACLALFVRHCVRSESPFVDPNLFRIRQFSGASLAMAPFAIAFGGFLLSVVLWEQSVWGWSALKIGTAIALGPFLVPVTSLLFAGRLITRFGPATVVVAGLTCFGGAMVWWATVPTAQPELWVALVGIAATGVGVGLTLPTLMGAGTGSLPGASFATGSGVINMIRQTGLAVGVALFVAMIGAPASLTDRMVAFEHAWWGMGAITAVGLIPTWFLLRPRRQAALAVAVAGGQ